MNTQARFEFEVEEDEHDTSTTQKDANIDEQMRMTNNAYKSDPYIGVMCPYMYMGRNETDRCGCGMDAEVDTWNYK